MPKTLAEKMDERERSAREALKPWIVFRGRKMDGRTKTGKKCFRYRIDEKVVGRSEVRGVVSGVDGLWDFIKILRG